MNQFEEPSTTNKTSKKDSWDMMKGKGVRVANLL